MSRRLRECRSKETRELKALKVRLRSPLTWFVLVVIASTVVGTATVRRRFTSPTRAETSARVLLDLHGSAELRARFNADKGNARLVLLLSPT